MATVWHPTKGLKEGRADQFSADDGWIHDLSAVNGPIKYWKTVAGAAVMMDQSEIDAVDAQEAADVTASEQGRMDVDRVLRALALAVKDEINILRAEHGFAPRTNTQLINAIKGKV